MKRWFLTYIFKLYFHFFIIFWRFEVGNWMQSGKIRKGGLKSTCLCCFGKHTVVSNTTLDVLLINQRSVGKYKNCRFRRRFRRLFCFGFLVQMVLFLNTVIFLSIYLTLLKYNLFINFGFNRTLIYFFIVIFIISL